MARINTGPLAASISGSVGELTFARTRFGQVVQLKPIRKTPATPADLITRDRFRLAVAETMSLFTKLSPYAVGLFPKGKKPLTAYFIRAFYLLDKYQTWDVKFERPTPARPTLTTYLDYGSQVIVYWDQAPLQTHSAYYGFVLNPLAPTGVYIYDLEFWTGPESGGTLLTPANRPLWVLLLPVFPTLAPYVKMSPSTQIQIT